MMSRVIVERVSKCVVVVFLQNNFGMRSVTYMFNIAKNVLPRYVNGDPERGNVCKMQVHTYIHTYIHTHTVCVFLRENE
jgi:hypothetical protein